MATITQEDVRGTHDWIEEPLVIFEHEEHPNEQTFIEKYIPEGFDYAFMGCGDKYISDEDTSI